MCHSLKTFKKGKLHECTFCQKKFPLSSNHFRHLRGHIGELPLKVQPGEFHKLWTHSPKPKPQKPSSKISKPATPPRRIKTRIVWMTDSSSSDEEDRQNKATPAISVKPCYIKLTRLPVDLVKRISTKGRRRSLREVKPVKHWQQAHSPKKQKPYRHAHKKKLSRSLKPTVIKKRPGVSKVKKQVHSTGGKLVTIKEILETWKHHAQSRKVTKQKKDELRQVCDLCPKNSRRFVTKQALTFHQVRSHGVSTFEHFKCSQCPMAFVFERSRDMHVQERHLEPWQPEMSFEIVQDEPRYETPVNSYPEIAQDKPRSEIVNDEPRPEIVKVKPRSEIVKDTPRPEPVAHPSPGMVQDKPKLETQTSLFPEIVQDKAGLDSTTNSIPSRLQDKEKPETPESSSPEIVQDNPKQECDSGPTGTTALGLLRDSLKVINFLGFWAKKEKL